MKRSVLTCVVLTGVTLMILTIILACDNPFYPDGTEKYTVTFDSNGGNLVRSVKAGTGEKIKNPAAPVKENFIFDGWYKEPALATQWDFANDTVTEDVTLYAKWEYKPTNPFNIQIVLFRNTGSDNVSFAENEIAHTAEGYDGDEITLYYTIHNTPSIFNLVHYAVHGQLTATIPPEEIPSGYSGSSYSGSETYTVNMADVSANNTITIGAYFEHTNRTPVILSVSSAIGATYGDGDIPLAIEAKAELHGVETPVTLNGKDIICTNIDNPAVAGIDMDTGKLVVKKPGNAAITFDVDSDDYYCLNQGTLNLTVVPKPVTISGFTVADKEYDGTTAADITGTPVVEGIVEGDEDDVTAAIGLAMFADENAGEDKEITFSSFSIAGAKADNYTFTGDPTSVTASITPKPVTITLIMNNKPYDGNNDAASTYTAAVQDTVLGETLSAVCESAEFADGAVGSLKIVSFGNWTLNGATKDNYTLSDAPKSGIAGINRRSVTITGITVADKPYDGTTTANLSGTAAISPAAVSGDNVSIVTGTAVFADANAGSGKAVILSGWGIIGDDAGNYELQAQSIVTAAITPKALAITGVAATDRVYNATTSVTLSGGALSGIVGSDNVLPNLGNGTMADANAGNGKAVTTGITLGGASAGNYTLAQPAGLTVNITQKGLTIAGVAAASREYNRTNTVTLSGGTLVGVESGDAVAPNLGNGTIASADVGNGKVVTTGITLGGASAGNYTLAQPGGLTVNITAKPLAITGLSVANKTYDGTTTASVSGTPGLSGVISPDVVGLNVGSVSFATKDAGTGKAVSLSGFGLNGAQAANYSLPALPGNLTANITAKPLTITGVTATGRAYDGTAFVALSGGALSGVVSGDTVSFTLGNGTMTSASAANGKTVTTNIALTGASAANYTLAQPAGVLVNITPKTVTVTGVTAVNRVYDASTSVRLQGGTLQGVEPGDIVDFTTGSTLGQMADKNVGTNKPVTPNGIYLVGDGTQSNYTLTPVTGITVNITQKPITLDGVRGINRAYDGTTSVSLNAAGALFGVEPGDAGRMSFTTGSGLGQMANANVGNNKPVTPNGITLVGDGTQNNYTLTPPTITVNITPKPLTITGVIGVNREYNGSTLVALKGGTLVGVVSGESVPFTLGIGRTANANAGNNKAVTPDGITIGPGSVATNYTLVQPTGITVDIAKADPVTWNAGNNYIAVTATAVFIPPRPRYLYGVDLNNNIDPRYTVSKNGGSFSPGTFEWVAPDTAISGGLTYLATYTPLDTSNYNSIFVNVRFSNNW